jgi:hypothetical protein
MAKRVNNQIIFRLRPNSKKDQVIAKWKAEMERMGENVSERARDIFYRAIIGESGRSEQLTVNIPVVEIDNPGPVERAGDVPEVNPEQAVDSLRKRYGKE